MFIRWQYKQTVQKWTNKPETRMVAVLVESVRINGQPRQRHIAYLGHYWPRHGAYGRKWFWENADAKLDQLNLTPADRHRLEAALALKLPRPTTQEIQAAEQESEERDQALLAELKEIRMGH
jgi:hypothetical protein